MAKVDWDSFWDEGFGSVIRFFGIVAFLVVVISIWVICLASLTARAEPLTPIGFSVDTVVENCHVVDCVLVNRPDWYGMICDTLHDTTRVFALPEIEPDYDSTYSECIDGTRMMRVMLDEVTCWMSVVSCDSTFRPTGKVK